MANYKPSTKGVIARDTVLPPPLRDSLPALLLFAPFVAAFIFIVVIFAVSGEHIASYIALAAGIAIVVFVLIRFLIYRRSLRKKPPVYYLELDTVTSVDMEEEEQYVRKLGVSGHRTVRREKRYIYRIAFKSRRNIERIYREFETPYDQFPTMKNRENIPRHMTTVRSLADGDICYLLFCEGSEIVLEIFDSKYYVPSPVDFEQFGDRYYLVGQEKKEQ